MIEVRQATFGYSGRPVVHVDSLDVCPGRCLGVFGVNGSGKSTLVRGLVGLLRPIRGTVKRQAGLRIGYVPQHRTMELHWPMTALDAAALALSAQQRFGWVRTDRDRLREAMDLLEVTALADRPFAALSGGQQQRLMLAGTLAIQPHVLVLDEPTEGLDLRSRRLLLHSVRASTQQGVACLLISHEVEDLLATSPQVAWIHVGDKEDASSEVELIAPEAMVARVAAIREAV